MEIIPGSDQYLTNKSKKKRTAIKIKERNKKKLRLSVAQNY